jgi:Protein of unknown function (DUF4244)
MRPLPSHPVVTAHPTTCSRRADQVARGSAPEQSDPPPAATARSGRRRRRPGDLGQATAEYALVIMAAGGIAIGVIAWANGTGSFTGLFESVIERLTGSL